MSENYNDNIDNKDEMIRMTSTRSTVISAEDLRAWRESLSICRGA